MEKEPRGLFNFAEPESAPSFVNECKPIISGMKPWKVLSVEDNPDYQGSIIYNLKSLSVMGRPVEVLTAASAVEAAMILSDHHDIGVILLDVVMETDDAGLRLVDTIRYTLGNSAVRIILLTGQPGFAPQQRTLKEYDIDEYWNKSDVAENLLSIVEANLIQWNKLSQLEQAHYGLQVVVDACAKQKSRHDAKDFADAVINKSVELLISRENLKKDGVLFLSFPNDDLSFNAICAAGVLAQVSSYDELKTLISSECVNHIKTSLASSKDYINEDYSILNFAYDGSANNNLFDDKSIHLAIVKTTEKLNDCQHNFLQVFSDNLRTNFSQILLLERFKRESYIDTSLNVYNRNWIYKELRVMTDEQKKNSALILISINDYAQRAISFGHEPVEAFMQEVYVSLVAKKPKGVTIARISLDTFAFIVEVDQFSSVDTLKAMDDIAIHDSIVSRKVRWTQARIDLIHIDSGVSCQEVINLARTVLYQTRQANQTYGVYSPAIIEHVQKEFVIWQELTQAIADDSLSAYLQPKFDLNTNKVVGFEALVRWIKADGTIVSPADFIPVAEKTGLVESIDLMMLRKSAAFQKQLIQQGYSLPISCNATLQDLTNPDFINEIVNFVTYESISPELLAIEITETQAMQEIDKILLILEKLASHGVSTHIDDFGTGYSSLKYIADLPADTIKLDQAFVKELGIGSVGEHIAEIVVDLGKRFDFKVVAEGVETELQRNHLIKLGCHTGQGYLFAKPMPSEEVFDWLNQQ